MIPDVELQLQVVIKSLTDNVLPAVDTNNELAVQQAQLSIATLQNVRSQLPLLQKTLLKDISLHLGLLDELAALAPGAPWSRPALALAEEINGILSDPKSGICEMQDKARLLRETISEILDSKELSDSDSAAKLVMSVAEQSLLIGRAYTKSMGFEPDATRVPDLSELVAS